MQTPSSSSRPPKDPRAHLRPLDTGPWLEDLSAPRWWLRVAGAGGVLCCASLIGGAMSSHAHVSATDPRLVFLAFGVAAGALMLVFGLSWLGVAWLVQRTVQHCPECLGTMARGATTCPHCHFHPPQGGQ